MYNIKDMMYVWLDSFDLTLKKKEEIISVVKNIENLFDGLKRNKDLISKIVGESVFTKMLTAANERYLNNILQKLDDLNIFCLTCENEYYPKLLKNIDDKPLVLYTKGNFKVLNNKCIGIVGTRRPTRYGREMTAMFTKKLAQAGLTPTSGLAFGIDTCVAQTSVDLGVPTIAVLAGGLDSIYPSQNTQLSEQILQAGGVLVSEHPPYSKPAPHYFLERNRIISGLSLGVLVVEAGTKSGAKKTAYDAVEQNRELFVIPGNIDSYASAGCNELINSMPDAFCISPNHILESLKIQNKNVNENSISMQFSFEQKLILDCLGYDEISLDEIQEITNLDSKTLLSELTSLEINGIIKKLSGNYYAKINLPN